MQRSGAQDWGICRTHRSSHQCPFSQGHPPQPRASTSWPLQQECQEGGAGKTMLSGAESSLGKAGPYNPAAALPPSVKKILDLEFVEMAELRADIWVEEPPPDTGLTPRRTTAKPPVTDIKVWLECYSRMAALLVTRFPDKGPELWAYQTTILRAAHNYEGSNWVAYDRQFRRDMLARKDLN